MRKLFAFLLVAVALPAFSQTRDSALQADNFNRSSLGTTNWTQLFPSQGAMTIYSSVEVGGSNALGDAGRQAAVWSGPGSFDSDHWSSLEIASLGFLSNDYSIGVIVRASTDTNANRDYYELVVFASSGGPSYTTQLRKVANGTTSVIHSASVAWSTGDRIELEAVSSTISGFKNGTALGGSFTYTDPSPLTTGNPGIAGSGSTGSPSGDNWQAGNFTAGGTAVPVFLHHYQDMARH